MGEMADFTNDERMDEIEDMESCGGDPWELYERGHIDEFGFQPFSGEDLVPPG